MYKLQWCTSGMRGIPPEFLRHVHVGLTHTSVGSRVRTKNRNSESYSHVCVCMVHMYTVGTNTTNKRDTHLNFYTFVCMLFQQNLRTLLSHRPVKGIFVGSHFVVIAC